MGASTHLSQAVAWEIDRGLSLGKRVVAVNLTRRAVPVPEVLTRNAIEPLPSGVRSLLALSVRPAVAEACSGFRTGKQLRPVAALDHPVANLCQRRVVRDAVEQGR